MVLQREPIGRREFLKYLGVAVAAVGATSLVACKNDDEDVNGEAESGIADTLIYAQGAEPRALDPAYFDDGESAKPAGNIYEGLYKYGDRDTTVLPCLATDFPDISDDGLTYTITLREGVKFHDGTDFNADAIVASWERQLEPMLDPDMPYATFVFGEEAIESGLTEIEVVDEYTVKLTMRAPSTAFLKNMAMTLAAPIASPTALEANNNNISEKPCGTGPYKFESWIKEDSVMLTAFDDYWDTDNQAKTKNIIFKVIPENNTRVTALLNDEVDIIDGVDVGMADQILKSGYTLFAEDGMTINYMAFNNDSGVCTDVEVRRAICQAIDVDELVFTLYGEYATVANSVMPHFMAPYDKDIPRIEFDPEAAREILSDKGVTKLSCISYENPRPYNARNGAVLAETIIGYLNAIGIEVDIATYNWTDYKSKVQTEAFDFCFYGWTGDNGDPDNFMNLLADSNWAMNVGRFNDADYKALIKEGLETPEGPDRDAVYQKCEEMVAEKRPWLVLSHSKNLVGLNPKVVNFYYHPTGSAFMKTVYRTEDE
ncbi:MAG: ABC transporter substrate-binding protein [Coriobacteriia bacterium]|nr:ABC transporter substrate-binding protein [Coriobacteriia bacterium]